MRHHCHTHPIQDAKFIILKLCVLLILNFFLLNNNKLSASVLYAPGQKKSERERIKQDILFHSILTIFKKQHVGMNKFLLNTFFFIIFYIFFNFIMLAGIKPPKTHTKKRKQRSCLRFDCLTAFLDVWILHSLMFISRNTGKEQINRFEGGFMLIKSNNHKLSEIYLLGNRTSPPLSIKSSTKTNTKK